MTRVRPFRKDDIAEVVALRGGAFRSSEQDDEAVLGEYFAEVFFGNPWSDETLPSLVCEDDVGRVVGFLGVVPRRMTAYGVPLRVATTTQFMVAPSAPALVGSQLLRTLFDGPQGFSLADVASAASRRLWECLGGITVTASSLTWIRLLRPFRHILGSATAHGLARGAGALVAAPLDALTTRLLPECRPPRDASCGVRLEMIDADLLAHLGRSLDGRAVRGDYDAASLAWLLDMMGRKHSYGTLRRAQIVNERGHLLGWYLVYVKAGGNARVAHLGARPGSAGVVLDHLFREAWSEGCTAVSGRFDARLADALTERHCLIYGPQAWVLAHSRDRGLLDAIMRDDAALTRLDAEWWMAF